MKADQQLSTDITFPLSMFQHTLATKEETKLLLHSIRRLTGAASSSEEGLNELFELMWPKLETTLKGLVPNEMASKRETRDMVEEILESVRELATDQHKQASAELSRRLRTKVDAVQGAAGELSDLTGTRPNKPVIDLTQALQKSLGELPKRKTPAEDNSD